MCFFNASHHFPGESFESNEISYLLLPTRKETIAFCRVIGSLHAKFSKDFVRYFPSFIYMFSIYFAKFCVVFTKTFLQSGGGG